MEEAASFDYRETVAPQDTLDRHSGIDGVPECVDLVVEGVAIVEMALDAAVSEICLICNCR